MSECGVRRNGKLVECFSFMKKVKTIRYGTKGQNESDDHISAIEWIFLQWLLAWNAQQCAILCNCYESFHFDCVKINFIESKAEENIWTLLFTTLSLWRIVIEPQFPQFEGWRKQLFVSQNMCWFSYENFELCRFHWTRLSSFDNINSWIHRISCFRYVVNENRLWSYSGSFFRRKNS